MADSSSSASAKLPPPPTNAFLQWVTQHPEQVAAYLATVYALQSITISYVVGGATKKATIQLSRENAVIHLEIS